jgi:glutathione S-transferase
MITLFQFPRIWNVDNPSPFCMKVETYLRLAKIPYKVKVVHNPGKAPKKKLPFIKEEDGTTIPDSEFIIKHLVHKYGDKLDAGLLASDRARMHAIRCFLERQFQLAIIYQRWVDDDFWPQTREAIFGKMPPVLMQLVSSLVRKRISSVVRAAGWYQYSKDEVYAIVSEDLRVSAELLGEKPFFMGDKPTSIDAVAYAIFANMIKIPVAHRLQDLANRHKNIVDYVDRMEQHLTSLA